MKKYLTFYLILHCVGLFAQKQSVPVIVYEGESYFLYPEKQSISFNPGNLIWKAEVKVSKMELKKYKWHERRFFKKELVATKFPIDGKWIQLFDIDTLLAAKIFEIKDGLPNGEFRRFNEYGQLVETGTYLNGNRSGIFHFYPDLTKPWREEYTRGEYKMSDSMYYDLAFLPYYHVMKEGKNGRWETRAKDGDLIQVEYYTNGQLDGQRITYHHNGARATEEQYTMGSRNGMQRFWYKNGQLREESNYDNDLREGQLLSWYKNGQPKCNLMYEQDTIIEGNCQLYYPSGALFGKGKLEENVRIGDWIFWHEGGTKMAEGNYQEYTTSVCISAMSRPYLHSVPVGRWNYWYKNGNPLASGDYTAVKTSISRGEVYVAKMVEGSWICRDTEGKEIPCGEVEELLELEVKN